MPIPPFGAMNTGFRSLTSQALTNHRAAPQPAASRPRPDRPGSSSNALPQEYVATSVPLLLLIGLQAFRVCVAFARTKTPRVLLTAQLIEQVARIM